MGLWDTGIALSIQEEEMEEEGERTGHASMVERVRLVLGSFVGDATFAHTLDVLTGTTYLREYALTHTKLTMAEGVIVRRGTWRSERAVRQLDLAAMVRRGEERVHGRVDREAQILERCNGLDGEACFAHVQIEPRYELGDVLHRRVNDHDVNLAYDGVVGVADLGTPERVGVLHVVVIDGLLAEPDVVNLCHLVRAHARDDRRAKDVGVGDGLLNAADAEIDATSK